MENFEKHPGNQHIYDSSNIEKIENSILDGKNVLFLGSSVTYGYASLEDGIPEYFRQRFGCQITKEAVSGTTLVDEEEDSYVSRLKTNIGKELPFDLMICQLSTNDATQGKPLGEINVSMDMDSFDTSTITGAMEYIIAYVKKTWNCPVYFYTGSRYESVSYQAMVDRLYVLASKWKIGVLDLWTDDTFNQISREDRAIFMVDPIHPTKAGYMRWWCPFIEKNLVSDSGGPWGSHTI